jgi:DNA-3-methyladenine glycosylase I
MTSAPNRCAWYGLAGNPLYEAYHDTEWGVPEYDPRVLWEKLVLDGFQAGLSWITILKKRDAFRAAFDNFDPEKMAAYGEADRARLMADPGIVRSNAKIDAAIGSAKIYLAMRDGGEDFSKFCWDFVGGGLRRGRGRARTVGRAGQRRRGDPGSRPRAQGPQRLQEADRQGPRGAGDRDQGRSPSPGAWAWPRSRRSRSSTSCTPPAWPCAGPSRACR